MDFTQRHQATILNPFDENMSTGNHVFIKETMNVLYSVYVIWYKLYGKALIQYI